MLVDDKPETLISSNFPFVILNAGGIARFCGLRGKRS
jgi:hypothetical protein